MMNRAVFLDRDGVINEKAAPGDYIRSVEQFRLLPNIAEWIRLFNALGHLVIVVTNQRGVARGLMTDEALSAIHKRMVDDLASRHAHIDDIFSCTHSADSCECRKPKPGLVYAARDKWSIDLAHSLLLGDSESDRELAIACNIPFLQVTDGCLV
jgi:D-glycero-D-manno-heptose 1,7-bisphosphate phosphatase